MNADKNVTATFNLTPVSHTHRNQGRHRRWKSKKQTCWNKTATDCNEVYKAGTAVTSEQDLTPGSTFAGWSGDTSDGQVTMDADKTLRQHSISRQSIFRSCCNPCGRSVERWIGDNIFLTYSVMNQGSCRFAVRHAQVLPSRDTSITNWRRISWLYLCSAAYAGASFTLTSWVGIISYKTSIGNNYIGAIVDPLQESNRIQ